MAAVFCVDPPRTKEPNGRSSSPDGSSRSMQQFLAQESACTSSRTDTDIADLLREIARLQDDGTRRHEDADRNIEDIISEAETLVSETSGQVCGRAPDLALHAYLPHRRPPPNITKKERSRARTAKRKESPRVREAEDPPILETRNVAEHDSLTDKPPSKESLNVSGGQFAISFLNINEATNVSEPIQSPKLKKNDIYHRKLNVVLEKLKDTSEKFNGVQVQYELLIESNKQLKVKNDTFLLENKNFESKLIEKDGLIEKLQKDLEAIKLQSSQCSLEVSRLKDETERLQADKQTLTAQNNKGKMCIQDLQRQCKEMEGVMSRRHPDSVSALIVASKQSFFESETKKLLEKRINDLEKDTKNIEEKHKKTLINIQDKVNSMKENYETHISDLEKQVINLQLINSEMKEKAKHKTADVSTETFNNIFSTVATQTQNMRPVSGKGRNQNSTSNVGSAQIKEDNHLMATVRGLNLELTTKDKNISKLNKELNEAKKNIQKLRDSSVLGTVSKLQTVGKKPDQKQISTKSSNIKIMKISTDVINNNPDYKGYNKQENVKTSSRTDFLNLQKDYERLKNKRINDLVELQTIHEKELTCLNLKVLTLQSDVDSLNSTVGTLKDQIKLMDTQLSDILVERNNLKAEDRHRNSADYLINKSCDECYGELRKKIMELERQYEGREVRLKTLINSLDAHVGGLLMGSGKCTVSIPSHTF